MTKRNRFHSRVLITIGALLKNWRDQSPEPRGEVLAGEASCILSHDPDNTVGIDVAYFGPDVAEFDSEGTTLMDGPPILAVEILSPSDKKEDIDEKIDEYLAAEVKLVWIVDTHLETVTVLRSDAPPQSFNVTETIDAEPYLPGFSTPVAKIFE